MISPCFFNKDKMYADTQIWDSDKKHYETNGHIHVSYPHKTQEKSIMLIKYMDAFVGIPSVILDSGEDAVKRRELYGKAGCFRLTRYGKLN